MVSEIGRWAPDFARGLAQARQQPDRFECSDSGICDFDCMMVVHELLVLHPFDRVAEGLGRDIPISDIELHPLVERAGARKQGKWTFEAAAMLALGAMGRAMDRDWPTTAQYQAIALLSATVHLLSEETGKSEEEVLDELGSSVTS